MTPLPIPILATRHRRDWLIALAAGFCTVLLTAWLFGHRLQRDVQQQARESAQLSQEAIDRLLDDVNATLRQVEPLIALPCQELRARLGPVVAHNPYVRAVGVVHGQHLHCLSTFGRVAIDLPGAAPQLQQVELQLNKDPLAGAGLINLDVRRQLPGGVSMLASLDMRLLQPFLRRVVLNKLQEYGLVIDGQMFLRDRLAPTQPAVDALSVSVASARYPFGVFGQTEQAELWEYLLREEQLKLPLFLLAGALAGIVTYLALRRWRSLNGRLEQALRNQEFLPYYQPLIDSRSGRCVGAEVLMRWQPPGGALIPPDRFIPQLEENGQIAAATTLLMRQVAADLAGLSLPPDFHLSINISPCQLTDPALAADCRLLQDAVAANQGQIVLELTERVALESTGVTQETLQRLRDQGVKIAIDDFGTGHSSLAYLTELKVDYLKIDRRFVSTIRDDVPSAVLDAIIALGRQLNLVTVAEGVENERQLAYLRTRRVSLLQGYLYARPMDYPAFGRYLADHTEQPAQSEPAFSYH
ncbi:EAL domain-containing protein [Crenobacter sp. SG2303]|uniref:cyclic-guanylate-specific phosphodiesterase n=1 Tax=Crenobacter oryzisoli TaxID=3056844 RepID=A0ABT7XMJ9_9NEIS|nr:EAL domain-containing protein [Crenobacter sp. SG2303]MDN0074996.1 EAL domain-containing protein [Crenobacter sp. SG2303]